MSIVFKSSFSIASSIFFLYVKYPLAPEETSFETSPILFLIVDTAIYSSLISFSVSSSNPASAPAFI